MRVNYIYECACVYECTHTSVNELTVNAQHDGECLPVSVKHVYKYFEFVCVCECVISAYHLCPDVA